jgi:hypothetical protein
MKFFGTATVLAVVALSAPASAQDTITYGTIEYGELPSGTTYSVPLAPGETVIDVYAAPPAVQTQAGDGGIVYNTLPLGERLQTTPYTPPPTYAPSVDIDRVTGQPRNTPGWSGKAAGPAGIGCFPQGVCKHLNR